MSIVLITGSTGLVGSEAVTFFSEKGFEVVGIDNNLRKFFGIFKLIVAKIFKVPSKIKKMNDEDYQPILEYKFTGIYIKEIDKKEDAKRMKIILYWIILYNIFWRQP